MCVLIDPGHGGWDPGATGNRLTEKDLNLQVALKVKDLLAGCGFDVKMTRSGDETISVQGRIALSNSLRTRCIVSIHHNAAKNPDARGLEVFHSVVGGEGKRLAECLYAALMDLGLPGRGVKTKSRQDGTDYYAIIRETKAPAVITECGFVTSPEDAKLLAQGSFLEREAQAIAWGIQSWLGVYPNDVKALVERLKEAEDKLAKIKAIISG